MIHEEDGLRYAPDVAPELIAMGVDPGFRYCGVGVLALQFARTRGKLGLVGVRALHVERIDTGGLSTAGARLNHIAKRLSDVGWSHAPRALAVENISAVRAGKESRGLGASAAGDRMKEIPGMCRLLVATLSTCSMWELMPASYRKLLFGTGLGRGKSKEDVRRAVRTIVGLDAISLDESEACALALGAGVEHVRGDLCFGCASAACFTTQITRSIHAAERPCCQRCWHANPRRPQPSGRNSQCKLPH